MNDGYCKICKSKGKEVKLVYVTKKTPIWVYPIWPPTEEFECPECQWAERREKEKKEKSTILDYWLRIKGIKK